MASVSLWVPGSLFIGILPRPCSRSPGLRTERPELIIQQPACPERCRTRRWCSDLTREPGVSAAPGAAGDLLQDATEEVLATRTDKRLVTVAVGDPDRQAA